MSKRTLDILDRWVAETVRPVPPDEVEKEAKRLATEFAAFAEDAGVDIENLETEITEDLESFMADALKAAAGMNGDEKADSNG
jgi:hypothetical protein